MAAVDTSPAQISLEGGKGRDPSRKFYAICACASVARTSYASAVRKGLRHADSVHSGAFSKDTCNKQRQG